MDGGEEYVEEGSLNGVEKGGGGGGGGGGGRVSYGNGEASVSYIRMTRRGKGARWSSHTCTSAKETGGKIAGGWRKLDSANRRGR